MTHGFVVFTGNCPKNVSRDAKYSVRSSPSGPVVRLLYRTDSGEEWHATTRDHSRLVDMVNAVKIAVGDAFNGAFYINEHGQVIVPAGSDARYYLAGDYDEIIEFEFEGNVLSGRGVDLQGRTLEPGDRWIGPRPGIPYQLAAGGNDIYFRSQPRADVIKKELLSKHVGADAAKVSARRIQAVKGWQGGRFYVNEWREIFGPVERSNGFEHVYIGHLEHDDPWFPAP